MNMIFFWYQQEHKHLALFWKHNSFGVFWMSMLVWDSQRHNGTKLDGNIASEFNNFIVVCHVLPSRKKQLFNIKQPAALMLKNPTHFSSIGDLSALLLRLLIAHRLKVTYFVRDCMHEGICKWIVMFPKCSHLFSCHKFCSHLTSSISNQCWCMRPVKAEDHSMLKKCQFLWRLIRCGLISKWLNDNE